MIKYLPYGRQSITSSDIFNVKKVLKSDFLTTGPTIKLFEESLGKYCKSKFAVAVNSATSALHIACLAIGVKKMILFGPALFHSLPRLIVHFIVGLKLIL